MVETTKTFKYSKSGKAWSLILLWVVIIVTLCFSLYNYFLEKQISELNTQISEHNQTIEKLKSQKNIHVYSLIKQHGKVLWELDKRSQITLYLEHLTTMSSHYNFEARGFALMGGLLSSRVTFEDNEYGIAHKKATRFISDYRNDDKALFDLEFISWVDSAQWDVKFPINLNLQ